MNFVDKAERIARKAHKKQKRWGGEPYIIHPEAIVENIVNLDLDNRDEQYYMATAWLHDVIEDCNISPQDLVDKGIPLSVVESVMILTKEENEDYLEYILKVKKNRMAREIKILDIRHNIESLPKKDSELNKTRLQRYNLAIWVLEH